MNPWAVDAGCPRTCAVRPADRVGPVETGLRYTAVSRELARSLTLGERLTGGTAPRTQARRVLRALGVRVEAAPAALSVPGSGSGTLIVANHISWLDVVALLAVEPVSFVAKKEVGRWPVVGTLARRMGTQFVDRERGWRALPSMVDELATTLASGRSVLVFPQATTWCSVAAGRFRRAAFQAAVDAGAAVRPVTVTYRQGGAASTAAAFLGDEGFGQSLRRVAVARGMTVRIIAHAPLYGNDRRELAAGAWAAVSAGEAGAGAHG